MKKRHFFIILSICILLFIFVNKIFETNYGINILYDFLYSQEFTENELNWLNGKSNLIYGADRNSPPLMYVDEETGQYKGFTIDYLSAISIEIETDIKTMAFDWDVALEKLSNGETDICDMFPSKERAKKFDFSDPIYNLKGIVLAGGNNKEINKISDLEGKRIAIPKGDYGIEYLEENFNSIEYVYTANIEESIHKIIEGKADALLGDEPVVTYFVKEKDLYSYVKILDEVVYERDVVLAVKKGDSVLINILNKSIESLEKTKTIENIHQKWFGFSSFFVKEKANEKIVFVFIFLSLSLFISMYLSYLWNKSLKRQVEKRTRELYISRKDLQITFDGMSSFLIVIDDKKNIKNANLAFKKFLYSQNGVKEKFIGENINKYNFEFKTEKFLKAINSTLIDKENIKVEISIENKFYSVKTYSLYKSENGLNRILIMIDDITKERISEFEILHSSKMSAIGQLAAGVAHEIRNPLGLIRNYNYVLKKRLLNSSDEIMRLLKGIEGSVQRASDIIDNLLNFSRIFGDKFEYIEIYDFIEKICELEKNDMEKRNILCKINCSKELKLYTNAESLKHVIINLLSNAIDSISNGGEINISANILDKKFKLDFSDNGVGIKESDLENIFNPFFTNKVSGKGTGLGLYVVYNEIIKQGGNITVKSELNKGTKFNISLPIKLEDD